MQPLDAIDVTFVFSLCAIPFILRVDTLLQQVYFIFIYNFGYGLEHLSFLHSIVFGIIPHFSFPHVI